MPRITTLPLTLMAIAALSGCSAQSVSAAEPAHFPNAPLVQPDLTRTVVADGLKAPWGLTFLPGGGYLVTEKFGSVVRIDEDGTVTPLSGSPETVAVSQGGLQDIALSPDFETDQTVFISYSYGTRESNGLAVHKARLDGDALIDGEDIYSSELRKNTTLHYGGRLLFMPDGKLLVTVGEGSRYREKAQMMDSDYGKLLRLNVDGTPAADNPDLGEDALPEIYTSGHRNAQGIIYDPVDDVLWLHEHGPQGGDELNKIEAGKNYGWPVATYGIEYNGATISPFTEYAGMEPPVLHWTPSIAPSGMTLYRGDLFPEWDGDLLVGGLKFQKIHRLDMEDGRVIDEQIVVDMKARVRDVRLGPGGAVYVLTDDTTNGQLVRLTPAE